MEPVEFPEQNAVATKPEDWNDDQECGNLGVFINPEASDGIGEIISCWEVSEEELKEINETKKVYLIVYGKAQLPVCITGICPFIKQEEPELKKNKGFKFLKTIKDKITRRKLDA